MVFYHLAFPLLSDKSCTSFELHEFFILNKTCISRPYCNVKSTMKILSIFVAFIENMNFIAIYDFNHISFTFAGFIGHNTDQIWWHCSLSICQVTNIQNILFPNVPWHCTHWCRSWSHLPTCSSQLRRYSSN